ARPPHDGPPRHVVVVPGAGEGLALVRRVELDPRDEPGCIRRPQAVGVEADSGAYPSCPRPAVAEMESHGVVGLTRDDPDGRARRAPPRAKLDHLLVREPEPFRGR